MKNGDHPQDDLGGWVSTDEYWGAGHKRTEGRIVGSYKGLEPSTTRHESCGHTYGEHGTVQTLEGPFTACPGDWIITGTRGEYYPIKDNIFHETYQEVDDE